ncbi:uncharacterized protein BO80DRAFT_278364 [Aspergillus ibericus CBS 121593]|uniref:Uncharacterized protein n=1 Tax=Aspergillus ibericus CBS 121593 TaxID=1448316 RepID=A0A395GII8_9EURO|nr:hypothetical protein BO80DRAFT_278364 [Aspergillus ibericus CBS 121593]RAK95174.1 hypothetical protein BO80DRAFT_278364 [Aspergillus ibericus CBS 121593]
MGRSLESRPLHLKLDGGAQILCSSIISHVRCLRDRNNSIGFSPTRPASSLFPSIVPTRVICSTREYPLTHNFRQPMHFGFLDLVQLGSLNQRTCPLTSTRPISMARDTQIASLACGDDRERRVAGSAYHFCPVLAWNPAILGSATPFAIGWIMSPTVDLHFKSDWRTTLPVWPEY